MSIDFGTDIYEEPLVAKTLLPEDNAEVSLRPHTLAEYIGQTKAKENLSVFIEPPGGGRSRWIMCCSTALRVWARPRWRASSPPRWGSTSASPPARPLKSPVIWRPC